MRIGSQPTFIRRGLSGIGDCPRCGGFKPAPDWRYCRDCTLRMHAEQTADRLERRDRAG